MIRLPRLERKTTTMRNRPEPTRPCRRHPQNSSMPRSRSPRLGSQTRSAVPTMMTEWPQPVGISHHPVAAADHAMFCEGFHPGLRQSGSCALPCSADDLDQTAESGVEDDDDDDAGSSTIRDVPPTPTQQHQAETKKSKEQPDCPRIICLAVEQQHGLCCPVVPSSQMVWVWADSFELFCLLMPLEEPWLEPFCFSMSCGLSVVTLLAECRGARGKSATRTRTSSRRTMTTTFSMTTRAMPSNTSQAKSREMLSRAHNPRTLKRSKALFYSGFGQQQRPGEQPGEALNYCQPKRAAPGRV